MPNLLKKSILRPITFVKRYVHNEYILSKQENGVREITLIHEKTRNALSFAMMSNLIDAINFDKDDVALRVIVLSAMGNVFSAGHNLKEFHRSHGVDNQKLIFHTATKMIKSIIDSPVPVIAKVDGLATAAGCQLVSSCDIIICSDTSRFSTPGVNYGVFCSTPGIAISRDVSKPHALYMLFTGNTISAQEAYEYGLVTKVVPKTNLKDEVDRIADSIKCKSRKVIAIGKKFYYQQRDQKLLEALKLGENIMVENINTQDGQEGIDSFVEKRKPKWSHN